MRHQIKVGQLVKAKEGPAFGRFGLVVEISSASGLLGSGRHGVYAYPPLVDVLWNNGETQKWVASQFLEIVE